MKKVIANVRLSALQWGTVLFFSVIIFLSLGLLDHQTPIYRTTFQPAPNNEGAVKVVFYDARYENYLSSGALLVPQVGWRVEKASDSTTLTAEGLAEPLVFYSEGDAVVVGLLHYAKGGVAQLVNGDKAVHLVSLRSDSEYVSTLTLGGSAPDVVGAAIGIKKIPVMVSIAAFGFIFATLMAIALMQLSKSDGKPEQTFAVGWREILYLSLPLFLSTSVVLLAYWPGNVAYDGSLQWYQAVTRGELYAPIGLTATLFMRLFTYFSTSPAWVVILQSVLSAVGVALILTELRYKGVPSWVAQICTIVLSLTPQYPIFFTNLGKDALSAVGLIFFAWSLLAIVRSLKNGQLGYFYIVIYVLSAVFSVLMRVNVMPAVILITIGILAIMFFHKRKISAVAASLAILLLIITIPRVAFHFSSEQQQYLKISDRQPEPILSSQSLPFGIWGTAYIYHLFGAAVSSGIPLAATDEAPFIHIAPRNAWTDYNCSMIDTTYISVSKHILLTQREYNIYLSDNQLEMAKAIFRIIRDNPSILFDRQTCVSKILWYIGFGQRPFQTTATLGYDNVADDFKVIAGKNRTLLPEQVRLVIHQYKTWSEAKENFWIFWKPALIFYLALFVILIRFTVRRDIGIFLALSIPLTLTLVLALTIPFPAYRYQYPSVLLMAILCTLAFSHVTIRRPTRHFKFT